MQHHRQPRPGVAFCVTVAGPVLFQLQLSKEKKKTKKTLRRAGRGSRQFRCFQKADLNINLYLTNVGYLRALEGRIPFISPGANWRHASIV